MSQHFAATDAASHPAFLDVFRKRLGLAAFFLAFLFGATTLALAHHYELGDLKIGHPWSRAVPAGASVAGGYFTVTNKGAAPDRLMSVSSDISAKAEIHHMSVKDGVMSMRQIEGGLEIPAGGTVALEPGAYHIMFMGLKQHPKDGERFKATLTFEKAGPITVEFAVQGIGEGMNGGGTMKMDHDHAK
jgi:copper(I)-binding protein